MKLSTSLFVAITSTPSLIFSLHAFTIKSPWSVQHLRPHRNPLFSSTDTSSADFPKPLAVNDRNTVNPNQYNVDLETAADLWTASVQEQRNAEREAGIPYMNSKSKDYFVDDVRQLEVSRDGGLGLELLELAGGRADGIGITIISVVKEGGNAEKAGILPGDAIASVTVLEEGSSMVSATSMTEETIQRTQNVECRDFDVTIDALANFPGEDAKSVILDIKRIRRWPKVKVTVEYPPSQCAAGVDNVKTLELFAGENLKRALQTRGIILDDPGNPKCDFCGSNACTMSVYKGEHLLNQKGMTEEKLMKFNPKCRISCKTVVGYNMQEGELGLRVNLSQWTD